MRTLPLSLRIKKKHEALIYQHRLFILSCLLFVFVFTLIATATHTLWFREDDLGTLYNLQVHSAQDLIALFSTDDRSTICPVNYQRSKPNIFSGFLRPLQHIVFTFIFPLFQHNAYAYFLFHATIHALNCVLLFLFAAYYLPRRYAFFTGIFFGFYPDISWLTWIATLQNSLATFFLLLAGIFYQRTTMQETAYYNYYSSAAAFCFFLSLLARENGIFIPWWLFIGHIIFTSSKIASVTLRISQAAVKTGAFFLSFFLYWLIRLWAFGLGTLSRTAHNLLLRFNLFISTQSTENLLARSSDLSSSSLAEISNQSDALTSKSHHVIASVYQIAHLIEKKFFAWLSSFLMISPAKIYDKLFMLTLLTMMLIPLFFAYRKEKRLGLFLLIGILFSCWPGVVAYPCPRYLNTMYPLIAFMLTYALYQLFKRQKKHRISATLLLFLGISMTIRGIITNRFTIYRETQERLLYKERFDKLFATITLPEHCSTVILLSSPFVSDIQSIFHYYTKNFSLKIAHEPFATLAEQGTFGCKEPFRCIGVRSRIEAIQGGFRLISDDPIYCCWRMRLSDYPLAWSAQDHAYVWQQEAYRSHVWYPCSLGTFKIHQQLSNDCITDMSFIFDERWLGPGTVFISWDTVTGCYKLLDSHHLQ